MWGMPIELDYGINYAYDTATTATTATTPATATATGSGLSGWLDSPILYPANDWRHAAELFRQSGSGLWLFNEDGKKVMINWVDDSFVPASPEEVAELYA